jgi:hypothetical protein
MSILNARFKHCAQVIDARLVDTRGLVMYRHKCSSLSRSLALAATPACNENPATFPSSAPL